MLYKGEWTNEYMHLKCGKCYKDKLVTNTYECSHTTPHNVIKWLLFDYEMQRATTSGPLIQLCNSNEKFLKKEKRECVCVCLSVCVTCHVPSVDLVGSIYTKPVVSPECGQVYVNLV